MFNSTANAMVLKMGTVLTANACLKGPKKPEGATGKSLQAEASIPVYCVKGTSQPTRELLTDEKGKQTEISGQWASYHNHCPENRSIWRGFTLSESMYQDALKQCKAKGFDVVQPAGDMRYLEWFPFKYGSTYPEHWHEERSGSSPSFVKYPQVNAGDCVVMPDQGRL